MTESEILYKTVIKNGFCIGCGSCTSLPDSPFKIEKDDFGNIIANPIKNKLKKSKEKVLDICPFSENVKNEDEIGNKFFPNNEKNDKLGYILQSYAGYVKEGDFRKNGSSGGVGKWIGFKLMQQNIIDKYFQLDSNHNSNTNDELFYYKLYNSHDKIIEGSKAAYYPTTLNDVFKYISENEGRYGITGVPCFIKAIRLRMLKDKVLSERIKFTLGIICGGMKSANQSKFIGWQMGIKPNDVYKIDFRQKHETKPASEKVYKVWSRINKSEKHKLANDLKGTDYGAGYFKPKACDYCDDVVGETADVSVGDAWMDKYSSDPKGNNLVIVRSEKFKTIIDKSINKAELQLDKISDEKAIASQTGGFRHRREGLAHRINKLKKKNEWHPKKRVKIKDYKIPKKRKKIYDVREKISIKSHEYFLKALQNDNLNLFYNKMKPLERRYKIAKYGYPIPKSIKEPIKRIVSNFR